MPLINKLLGSLVRGYQLTLSPFFGAQCRFVPSCSDYACQCLKAHGPGKSIVKIIWRILRCNPWAAAGYDPVIKDSPEKSFTKLSN